MTHKSLRVTLSIYEADSLSVKARIRSLDFIIFEIMNVVVTPKQIDWKDSPFFRKNLFTSPDHMISEFQRYIEWLDENKLQEAKLYGAHGDIAQLEKMRMPTMQGLKWFLKVIPAEFNKYRTIGKQWEDTFELIEEAMHAICIEGAGAGLLKETIVMRKLGLADKQEVNSVATRRVVILHSPDNERSYIEQPKQSLIEDAETD
jgi:hypothetical protein